MYEFRKKEKSLDNSEIMLSNTIYCENDKFSPELINPNEICNYIEKNYEMEGLVNETLRLVNTYFPNSKNYLHLFNDPEFENLSNLVIYIINEEKSLEANHSLYKLFLKDFNNLRESYLNLWKNLIILLKSNEIFCKKLKELEN